MYGTLQWTGNPARVYSHLAPRIPRIGSRSITNQDGQDEAVTEGNVVAMEFLFAETIIDPESGFPPVHRALYCILIAFLALHLMQGFEKMLCAC